MPLPIRAATVTRLLSRAESLSSLDQTSPNNTSSFSSANFGANSPSASLPFSALDLLAKEISDVESIDLAWKKGTGSPKGPFEILDIIGLKTAYEIVSMYLKVPSFLAPYNFKAIAKLLQKYIDEGKLGKSTKEGFYKYD